MEPEIDDDKFFDEMEKRITEKYTVHLQSVHLR